MKKWISKVWILICFLFATITVGAQTNLLLNGQADSKTEHWRVDETTVEETKGNKFFAVRNYGHFEQIVELPDEAIGKYALFIGLVNYKRIYAEGLATTNPPFIYVYMVESGASSYGKDIRDNTKDKNEWSAIYTIFQVPKEKSKNLMKCLVYPGRIEKTQNNDSAVRFDNLGLYLFETEEEALKFAKSYK